LIYLESGKRLTCVINAHASTVAVDVRCCLKCLTSRSVKATNFLELERRITDEGRRPGRVETGTSGGPKGGRGG